MVIEASANEEDTIMNLSFLGTPEVALTNADDICYSHPSMDGGSCPELGD